MNRILAWLILLSPFALFAVGCDSIECEDVRRSICKKACDCGFCQLEFRETGSFVLNDIEDCVTVLAEAVCTNDTETEALEACQSAVDASRSDCPYVVPKTCAGDAFKQE